MIGDDPCGRRPVIRMIAAIVCAFSFAAWLGLSVVGYLVPPEPALGHLGRMAAAVIFILSLAWAGWLYAEFRREGQ